MTSTVGQIITFDWDASVLGGSPPSANGVQIKLRGTAGTTATVEYGGIEWQAEYASNASASVTDSGWMNPPALHYDYWGPPRQEENLYLTYIADAEFNANALFIEFRAGANFDGYFQASRLVISDARTVEDAHGNDTYEDLGLVRKWADPSIKERMRSGALDREARKRWRVVRFAFSALSHDGADAILHSVQRRLGIGRDALWVFRPDDLDDEFAVVLGTLVSLDDVPQIAQEGWSVAMEVEETI